MEDLEQFQQIQSGNAEELERFADLLDITIINLKEAGDHQDLGDGSLYIQLQKKLSQSLLARYHRWLFENNMTESVVALQTWVLQESHFQTIASETIKGLTGQTSNTHLTQSTPNIVGERTFFIRTEACQPQPIQPCQVCRQKHRIWQCKVFKQEGVSERWNIAKRFQLCYRCLAEGHHGKSCQRTRQCGKNGCHKVHHRLLHLHQDTSRVAVFEAKSNTRPCSTNLQHEHQGFEAPSSAHVIFGTEGNNVRRTNSNFMGTYFNSVKMKVENTKTRLNLEELRATIDVSPVNKKSVDTNDGQTLLSKVKQPISCEAMVWDRFTTKKHVFTEGNQSHHLTRETRMRLYHGCEENDEAQRSPILHQHVVKFQNMAQTLEHPLSRDRTGIPVETSFQGGLCRNIKRQTDTFGQVQVG